MQTNNVFIFPSVAVVTLHLAHATLLPLRLCFFTCTFVASHQRWIPGRNAQYRNLNLHESKLTRNITQLGISSSISNFLAIVRS